ncbi:hypothetical protein EON68_00310 [archaeon]|nr:MAG: hypothetical protein EON68_00310 [archaeon]
MSSAPTACVVCATPAAKYRCPACRARYCTPACFATHKSTPTACTPLAAAAAAAASAITQPPHAPVVRARIEEESSAGLEYILPDASLMQLRSNDDVMRAVRDKRLQRLLLEIDGAPDRAAALERVTAREAPHFQEFIDAMLLAAGVARREAGMVIFEGGAAPTSAS